MTSLTIDMMTSLSVAIASMMGLLLSPCRDRNTANTTENKMIPSTFVPSLVPIEIRRRFSVALLQSRPREVTVSTADEQLVKVSLF